MGLGTSRRPEPGGQRLFPTGQRLRRRQGHARPEPAGERSHRHQYRQAHGGLALLSTLNLLAGEILPDDPRPLHRAQLPWPKRYLRQRTAIGPGHRRQSPMAPGAQRHPRLGFDPEGVEAVREIRRQGFVGGQGIPATG